MLHHGYPYEGDYGYPCMIENNDILMIESNYYDMQSAVNGKPVESEIKPPMVFIAIHMGFITPLSISNKSTTSYQIINLESHTLKKEG